MYYSKTVIGERIRTARENPFNGTPRYSQTKLAIALGLDSTSRTTIHKWERGIVLPPLEHLAKMCDLFGCELGYLLGEFDLPTRTETDIQKATGLSYKAIHKLRHCGELRLSDGYYDASHGIAKMLLNTFLESAEFTEIMTKLQSCYAAFTMGPNLDSELTGADVVKMQNCATDLSLVMLESNEAAEFFAASAADYLRQFAVNHIRELVNTQEEHSTHND